ncbi:Nrap protein [Lasallia pustulata]|uniref:U3 small nucleolar RNA-associated protein 22 n=1 Tax=Lasallia pustulata TaxID=136370 RepID=A0A1W5DB11_9LECA|nr:Nrap protein [Lasallia pustulata]
MASAVTNAAGAVEEFDIGGYGEGAASTTHDSTMFKLQMDELLAEMRPDYERRLKKVEKALHKLKGILEHIPERDPLPVSEAERNLRKFHKIFVPFPEPRPQSEVKYTLAYKKPANINVVGSYALKTAVKTEGVLLIDMAITMPSSLFQDKDYLNHRYFHKRAYYLACMAAGIQADNECKFNISFALQNDNELQPILVIGPTGGGSEYDFADSKCIIKIILAVSEDTFPKEKTLPDSNCLRKVGTKFPQAAKPVVPTPFYNATLRSESVVAPYLQFLHGTSARCGSYKDACVLGRIWLQQRGLGTSLAGGGFGHFELAATMAILLQGGGAKGKAVLSTGYSSYQLFKATLQFLTARDLVQSPLLFQCNHNIRSNPDTPLFFDGPRVLNVFFKMTPWSYAMLRHEARVTLTLLNESSLDRFEPTFITKVDNPLERFDSLIRVQSPSSILTATVVEAFELCEKLYKVLTTGLGDRTSQVFPIAPATKAWHITSSSYNTNTDRSLLIGFLHNPEKVDRAVDHGPPAEDRKAAAAFRNFWGEKAELRRFKDGSILESLIWTKNVSMGSILCQIIAYVIQRHINPAVADTIEFLGKDIDHLLPISASDGSQRLAQFQPLMNAYQGLEKQIRQLEGLPLQVREIVPNSPQLRYSSVMPPLLAAERVSFQPADCHVQFEGSARWPGNLVAIQKTKIAFLLRMGELLEESADRPITKLGLENDTNLILNTAFLDIVYPTGAAFRLRIHHEHGQVLLESKIKDKSLDGRSREEAAHALSAYKRDFIQGPLHTQALRTLCTRFPLLSPCIRLVKAWCNSHLLSPHVSEELVELLTIRTFVHPYPWQAPGSIMTGFLRTLAFISKWDWRSQPLIIDFSGDMASKAIDSINLRFEAWRKIDPGMNRMVMFAASNHDLDGVTWTEQGPSKVVATRLTSLAKAACSMVKEKALELEVKGLFVSSTREYDFVIHLNPRFTDLGRSQIEKQSTFKNLRVQSPVSTALVGYNPVDLYLKELMSLYGSNIVFFHNSNGGPIIAGLWSPQTGPRSWKVNIPYSTIPAIQQQDDMGTRISINKPALLNEMARLGGDLVTDIELH